MKTGELLKVLYEDGVVLYHHGGDHDIYYSPVSGRKFPVPRHHGKEMPTGTMQSTLRMAGLEHRQPAAVS